jgi:hypothetical protein
VHRKNIPLCIQQNATLHSLFYLETVLNVSGGTTVTAACREQHVPVRVWQIPNAVDTAVCAPDDGWWYHPKHVEQFPDKINCVTLHLVGHVLEYNYSYLQLSEKPNFAQCDLNHVVLITHIFFNQSSKFRTEGVRFSNSPSNRLTKYKRFSRTA